MTNRTAHIRLYKEIKPSAIQPIDLSVKYKQYHNFINSIKPKNDMLSIYNSGAITEALKKDKRVLGVTPKILAQLLFNVGTTELTGVVNGIDAIAENKFFLFNEYVVAGKYTDLDNIPNSIILGKGLADQMLANIGDVIQVTTIRGLRIPLRVVGYYQSGIADVDKIQSYASIRTTQKLLGEADSYITDLQIKLKDINQAPKLAIEYRKLFNVDALDIQTANAQLETGSSIRTLISYAVGVTLLIVAGFGIYNILNMLIYEKMDSIAILKATGFSGRDVNRIFTSIALSIGAFGGMLGLICGLIMSAIIARVPFTTPSLPYVKTYPIDYNIQFYIIGGLFALITTYFAGYLPARKASKVDPVVIIRGK
jgi:lipoprotein-releasing system permease protein